MLVLPDVTRLAPEEVEAIRAFVAAGGRIYASGTTSLADTTGHRSDDFALADVFGAHAGGRYEAGIVYYRPAADEVSDAIGPETHVSWGTRESLREPPRALDVPFLADLAEDTETLATFSLPYAYPHAGSAEDHQFASIHSSPPWTDTERAALVRHRFGDGLAVFSAAPLETSSFSSTRRLFTGLVRSLIDGRPRIQSPAPAQVWITLFDQLDRSRMVLSLLNYDGDHQQDIVALVDVDVAAPAGYRIVGARRTTDGSEVEHHLSDDRTLLSLSRFHLPLFEQIEVALEQST